MFEIREHAGQASDLLIRDNRLGDGLAAGLGAEAAILMRGHGVTVVGASLKEAVFRSVYVERNAEIQARALALGDVTYLTPGDAAQADAANAGQIDRAWGAWSLEVGESLRTSV